MSAPTGDPRLISELNELLGRELGRNQYGKPYFTWRWSEDLFWPAFPTGRAAMKETELKIPLIGTDQFETTIQQTLEPEYQRDRQTRKIDTWVICKWLTPWELILGARPGSGWLRHGEQNHIEKEPAAEALIAAWQRQFPGAAFPATGWRIPTDAYLPAGPHDENWTHSPFGHTTPHRQDTQHFIHQVKYQTSRAGDTVLADMLANEDTKNLRTEMEIGEECRDLFGAFLNPAPGKRGGFVSFPWTKQDRAR